MEACDELEVHSGTVLQSSGTGLFHAALNSKTLFVFIRELQVQNMIKYSIWSPDSVKQRQMIIQFTLQENHWFKSWTLFLFYFESNQIKFQTWTRGNVRTVPLNPLQTKSRFDFELNSLKPQRAVFCLVSNLTEANKTSVFDFLYVNNSLFAELEALRLFDPVWGVSIQSAWLCSEPIYSLRFTVFTYVQVTQNRSEPNSQTRLYKNLNPPIHQVGVRTRWYRVLHDKSPIIT